MLIFITFILLIQLAKAREINTIVIHTTDMPSSCGAKCVDRLHKARGWKSCGYHKIVMADGSVQNCRPIRSQGAHVRSFNRDSIGIAWAGKGEPNQVQLVKLKEVVKLLLIKYNLRGNRVFGHKHFPTSGDKTCPNMDMVNFRRSLNE